MKRVLLLATGDTIALSPAPGRGAYASGAELLAALPPGTVTADVVAEDITAEPSWDIEPPTMLRLARRVRQAVGEEGYDGVVVTHGVDTLAETAFLADLLIRPARGGVVFTGAVRPPGDLSADGPRNLASSIVAAADPVLANAGAVACFNDEIHAARWVRHIDATGLSAFSSAPHPTLARVTGSCVDLLCSPPEPPPGSTEDPELAVALIRTYPGIDPALLFTAVDGGARGLVLEGTGSGNVPVYLFAAINDIISWGIPVVIASRSQTREAPLPALGLGAELVAKMGAIGAHGLSAEKARIALMVALGTGDIHRVRDWFSWL